MPNLPAVFVELRATTDQFKAQLADAEKAVKGFADNSTTGMQKLQSVGKVAFAAIGASAVTFGTLAVKAALDGQQAHAQLVQAVTNSGTAFSSVSGQVDNMSQKFAGLGYENDQVEAALTRLVQATGSTSTGLQNMNLAADIARARNLDLATAAGSLGKILEGNMRGMTALGLATKDASGNTLTAAQAVAELTDRFGGAASANADTYMGKLQALNASWHNMTETVGNELLPVLANLAGDAAGVVGWFEQHRAAAVALAAVVGGPLVIAMNAYIAAKAVAFTESFIGTIQSIAGAIRGIFVPAVEAATAAETEAATAESFLTLGLSAVAGALGLFVMHQASSKSATDSTTSAMGDASSAAGDLSGAQGDLGDSVDATNGSLQAQSSLLKQLSGDTNAQQSEVLKLIGDQNSLDTATQKLKDTTGENSEATKQAAQHTKDLAQANKDVTQSTKDVTAALDKQTAAKKKLDDLMAPQDPKSIQDAADAHSAANDRLGRANIAVTDKTKDLNTAIRQYGAGSEEATLAQYDLNDALREVTAAQDDVDQTTQALGDAQRQTKGTTDDITQATSDYNDATAAVTDAQGKQKDAQDKLNTVLANKDAITAAKTDTKNLAENTLAWQQATNQLNTDWSTLTGLLNDPANVGLRDQLVGQLTAMKKNLPTGADTKGLSDLLDKLNGYASTLQQTVKPGSMLDAIVKGQGALPAGAPPGAGGGGGGGSILLGGIPDYSNVGLSGSGSLTLPGLASGGPMRAGDIAMVGEKGPEIFRADTAGTVIPNGGGLGGAMTVNVTVQGGFYGDTTGLALAVRDELLKFSRNNVGVLV